MAAIDILSSQTAHLAAICEIEQRISPHPWSLPQFRESLTSHQCRSALADKQVVGYIIWSARVDAELLNIGVHPDFQRQGLGALLLQNCLKQLRDRAECIFLEVRVSNFPAVQLYVHHGFAEVGLRRNYYRLVSGGSEDALIMARQIEWVTDG